MTTVEQKPAFVYVTYISTTPQRVWDALTSPSMNQQFWFGQGVHSSWEVGSPISLRNPEGVETHDGVVLAAEPPQLLSYTFHPLAKAGADEQPSRVTFTLESSGDSVKLTLVHDDFAPDSPVLASVSGGWPMILAGLKTLLETGNPLPLGAVKSCSN